MRTSFNVATHTDDVPIENGSTNTEHIFMLDQAQNTDDVLVMNVGEVKVMEHANDQTDNLLTGFRMPPCTCDVDTETELDLNSILADLESFTVRPILNSTGVNTDRAQPRDKCIETDAVTVDKPSTECAATHTDVVDAREKGVGTDAVDIRAPIETRPYGTNTEHQLASRTVFVNTDAPADRIHRSVGTSQVQSVDASCDVCVEITPLTATKTAVHNIECQTDVVTNSLTAELHLSSDQPRELKQSEADDVLWLMPETHHRNVATVEVTK
jgi:hypothetical protein